jgi:outer membrane usher protein FimD/PapC
MLLALPPVSAHAEMVVLNIVLNQEAKGECFVVNTGDGDFLVKTEDLKSMGFRDPAGTVTVVDGDPFVSLRSLPGVRFVLDERTLSLELTASPELLPKRVIDFQPRRQQNVYYPKDTGGFLNYGLGYSTSDSFRSGGFDGTAQLGVRSGDALFRTDASYVKTSEAGKFVRLLSSVTLDRREDFRRTVLGDFFASSGDLGGNLNLGGVSVSKVYRMDPYFIRYPLADFSGFVSAPSDAEIYVNGIRVRKERLSPGAFELKDLPNYGGVSAVSVVIKDPFGREHALTYPFYFTDQLLRKGLHEYSYNAGFLREGFGEESNRYGAPAISGNHRYGRSESLTLGIRGEGGDGAYNIGPEAVALVPGAGVVSGGISASFGEGRGAGLAALLSHSYQDNTVGTRIFLIAFSREYAFVGEEESADKIRYQAGAGISYGSREIGSFSLNLATAKKYRGQDTGSAGITYSKPLPRNLNLLASISRFRRETSGTEAFLGLTWFPYAETTVSTSFRKMGDESTQMLQAQKNPLIGEGFGARVSLENSETGASSALIANPYVQYNSRYAIVSAEYRGDVSGGAGGLQTSRIAASGGIATVGGSVGSSRPVMDSFGLVRVDGLEGVRVYQSNQEIGRTDAKGEIFLPNLASYSENQVSINDKDIPIEYMISDVKRYVSPPLRSGSVIRFEAKKFQAVTGFLKAGTGGGVVSVEYSEGKLQRDGKETPFMTGRGGEFYLEFTPPGTYEGSVGYGGGTCNFSLTIPESDEMMIDLGERSCEEIR